MADETVKPQYQPIEWVHQGNVTAELVCANIAANAGRDLPNVAFKKICICASGPSLGDNIAQLRERRRQGWKIAAMNGSYNFLQRNGLVADYMFMVDARKGVNLPFISAPQLRTEFIIASQCDPEIFEELDGFPVTIWQVFNYPGAAETIQAATAGKSIAMFPGDLNVGMACLNPIFAMGFRDWALFGFDGSVRGEDKHAFAQPQNDGEPIEEFVFPLDANNNPMPGAQTYRATPTMAHAASCMPDRISFYRRNGVRIEIVGDGLLPAIVRMNAAPDTGGTTVATLAEVMPEIPAARPRKRAVERLPIVTFKWDGHIPYSIEDVRIWARQAGRFTRREHELVCITDKPEELRSAPDRDGWDAPPITTLAMWRDHFEHGRDWHRLKLFAEEMADLIGPRFVVMDLDTVICGELDPLFADDAPFKAWRDPNRDQYCTALFMMDAGAFPHVWDWFDPVAAMRLRTQGLFGGYDQAWISHVLPGMPRWTADDGVLSFRKDMLSNRPLDACAWPWRDAPPAGARVINFHGQYKPRDPAVQAAFPWIAEYYR